MLLKLSSIAEMTLALSARKYGALLARMFFNVAFESKKRERILLVIFILLRLEIALFSSYCFSVLNFSSHISQAKGRM